MKNKYYLHPFLFSLYPVLHLISNNLGKVAASDMVGPVVANGLMVGIALVILRAAYRDRDKAGIGASFFILLFSLFGHLYELVIDFRIFQSDYRPLFIVYMVVLILGIWGIWRLLRNPQALTPGLNLVGLVLVAMQVVMIGGYAFRSLPSEPGSMDSEAAAVSQSQDMPDIYYILLDAYGRADMLQSQYGIDNQEWIDFLEGKGFYVAEEASSNYLRTTLSLYSSLNMQYVEAFIEQETTSKDFTGLEEAISHSAVRHTLEALGYEIFVIPNGINTTSWDNTNNATSPWLKWIDTNFFVSYVNTTLAVVLAQNYLYDLHRTRINNSFVGLETIPQDGTPKFVFAHIIAPHPPFVFNAQGEPIEAIIPYKMTDAIGLSMTSEEYIRGYEAQLRYVNTRMERTITTILERSVKPPIILIQGDHGPGAHFDWESLENNQCLKERSSILSAYYLPDAEAELYPQITPVNSFRLIFNTVFGLDYGLLPDQVYFAPDSNILQTTEITEALTCAME